MKTLELKKASKPLADYASDLGLDSLVITSNNKPVAAPVAPLWKFLQRCEHGNLRYGLNNQDRIGIPQDYCQYFAGSR